MSKNPRYVANEFVEEFAWFDRTAELVNMLLRTGAKLPDLEFVFVYELQCMD